MTKKADPKGTVTPEGLLMAHLIQIDTISMLLMGKGVFTQEEFFQKLKVLKKEYESRKRS